MWLGLTFAIAWFGWILALKAKYGLGYLPFRPERYPSRSPALTHMAEAVWRRLDALFQGSHLEFTIRLSSFIVVLFIACALFGAGCLAGWTYNRFRRDLARGEVRPFWWGIAFALPWFAWAFSGAWGFGLTLFSFHHDPDPRVLRFVQPAWWVVAKALDMVLPGEYSDLALRLSLFIVVAGSGLLPFAAGYLLGWAYNRRRRATANRNS